ncbi:unnamed protein product, partial [Rotaria sordida]
LQRVTTEGTETNRQTKQKFKMNEAARSDKNTALPNISPNARWTQNGIIVAGGHEKGNAVNQLHHPCGLYVDDDQSVLIADHYNHRIVEWKCGATSGQVMAGGNGPGNRNDQLYCPSDNVIKHHFRQKSGFL